MQLPRSREYDDFNTLTSDVNLVISQVYLLMTIGLMITAVVAAAVAGDPTFVQNLLGGSPIVFFGIVIGQLALVVVLTAAIHKLSPAMATALFVLYAALNGVIFSMIFLIYTDASIVSTFMVTGVTFGVMSFIGLVTKRDLTKLGGILFMALIGLVIASVVNLFLQSSGLYWIVTFAGILIFVGLTAWDTQRIKRMAAQGAADGRSHTSLAIVGALMLYLDFINLFLLLLRLFGRRR